VLPSLAPGAWRKNRLAGDGWLAVGDAGGLVDPITGEGLYYAMRSGDLASRVVLDDAHDLTAKADAYRSFIARDFGHDLAFASTLVRRVYLGTFLFRSVPAQMVQYIRRSPRFRELMQDLFAGTQPYLELRARLLRNFSGTLREVIMSMCLNRIIPESSRAGL
jgi:flavin-dependent dehydrogenase